MREQAKSISAFAANPLRARMLIRELERKCLEVKPVDDGERFDRFEHLNHFIERHQKTFVLPRRPFFRWRNGEALPNLTTRKLIDGLFSERIGSKWGGRGIDDPEQTLMVALDLISLSNAPNNHETLAEAEAILAKVNAAVRDLIPKIPNLDKPKFSSYRGGKALGSLVQRKPSRYANLAGRRVVAYPYITDRISPYDTVSPLCAVLMYLIKPNNKTVLPADLAQTLLLDFISGVIAAYILMLHRNPTEFQTGGLVVDLYRLVYQLFLCGGTEWNVKKSELIKEVFYNRFSGLPVETEQLKSRIGLLESLFDNHMRKAGISSAELTKFVESIDPSSFNKVIKWWSG
ncbi:hypothetical protein [Cellvibrio sp. UBA7671]|uniref:hypothetical protein n=1 Tax=Cellvibrio sp. UBA7671 TaxID=1946312 RepID=UPI002F35C602